MYDLITELCMLEIFTEIKSCFLKKWEYFPVMHNK